MRCHLGEQRVETLLDERVEPCDRLVEDQQLGLVHERLNQAELLAVTGRELPHRASELRAEALGQLIAQAPVHTSAQVGQVVEHRRPVELWVEREIAREITDPPLDLQALPVTIETEELGRAGGRPDQVQ